MKKWYWSKTLWTNVLLIVGIVIQSVTGKEILPLEVQASIIAIANIILRAATNKGLN